MRHSLFIVLLTMLCFAESSLHAYEIFQPLLYSRESQKLLRMVIKTENKTLNFERCLLEPDVDPNRNPPEHSQCRYMMEHWLQWDELPAFRKVLTITSEGFAKPYHDDHRTSRLARGSLYFSGAVTLAMAASLMSSGLYEWVLYDPTSIKIATRLVPAVVAIAGVLQFGAAWGFSQMATEFQKMEVGFLEISEVPITPYPDNIHLRSIPASHVDLAVQVLEIAFDTYAQKHREAPHQ